MMSNGSATPRSARRSADVIGQRVAGDSDHGRGTVSGRADVAVYKPAEDFRCDGLSCGRQNPAHQEQDRCAVRERLKG